MLRRLIPATTLPEIAQTVLPEPLETPEEMKAFYRDDLQRLRGMDRIGRMKLCMEDALAQELPFRAFLLGHPGVGKTTEMEHLLLGMQDRFRRIRLSVTTELNPGTLRFYDVLLLILIRLVQEASKPEAIGFEDHDLKTLLGRVRDHLSTKWTKHLRMQSTEFGAGIGLPFLKLLGNIKLGGSREAGSQEYELSFVSELVDLMNDVVSECNRLLKDRHNGQQWLIVLEDFEKIGLPHSAIRDVFIGLRPHLQGLNAHIVVTIPVWLHYSEEAHFNLPANYQTFVLPDIAVYQQDHTPNEEVLASLAQIVTARAGASLFEEGVLRRCCIASGGNVRDLFTLIRDAMLSARLRRAESISAQDMTGAVDNLRNEYKQRLGSTRSDEPKAISIEDKLTLLTRIYNRTESENRTAEVPNPALYLLLGQRCVLHYNGVGWMGVHPLVVDLLIDFGKLAAGSPGGGRG